MSIKDLINRQPKWQHADPDIRIKAIESITDINAINELAKSDPDPRVRCAAINKVTDIEQLAALALEPDEIGATARQQYCQILSTTEDTGKIQDKVSSLNNPILLKEIALSGAAPELAAIALEKTADEISLAEIAIHAPIASVRQDAAERISSIEQLESLQKTARQKDKQVHNIAKQKIRLIHTRQKEQQRIMTEAEEITAEIQQLANSTNHASFERSFNYLQTKWNALEPQFTEYLDTEDQQLLVAVRARYNEATSNCKAQINARTEERSAQESAEKEATQLVTSLNQAMTAVHDSYAAIEQYIEPVHEMSQRWHHLSQFSLAPELNEEYYRTLNKLEFLLDALKRWTKLKAQLPAIETAGKNIPASLEKEINHFHWPDEFPLPAELINARATLEKLKSEHAASAKAAKQSRQDALSRLSAFEQAIKEGHIKLANRL